MPAPPQNRPIMCVDSKYRYAGEYDKNPSCKASVPKESVDHNRDSSVETIGQVYANEQDRTPVPADHHRPGAPKRKAGPTDCFEADQSSNGSFHRIEVAIWQC